jgi:uncharacterized protein (UPF0548 family)
MAVRARRPSEADLEALLARCRDADLTYGPPGISLTGDAPAGLTTHRWTAQLPHDAFAAAQAAIRAWAVHRGAGLSVVTDGPLAVGTNVAMSAPLPAGFVDATCRVVEVVDEADRFGFAYGTLPDHPERGEESFLVVRDGRDSLRFDVCAVSVPTHPLARLAPPIADRIQASAVRRYLTAMQRAVGA